MARAFAALLHSTVHRTAARRWTVLFGYLHRTAARRWTVLFGYLHRTAARRWTVLFGYLHRTAARRWTVLFRTTAAAIIAATVAGDALAQAQQVYRYTDPEGRVVYSDRPPAGAAKDV